MAEFPNILLVILDSARAMNMGVYGYKRDTTPFLERFASKSTLYTQARSPSIHSIASHVSMFTGQHVEEHQAIHHEAQVDTTRTIWKELEHEYGYSTGLFTSNSIVAAASNLNECFENEYTPLFRPKRSRPNKIFEDAHGPTDQRGEEGILGNMRRCVHDDSPIKSFINCAWRAGVSFEDWIRDSTGHTTIFGGEFVDAFLKWEKGRSDPWAACINLMDTHRPWEPLSQYDQWGSSELWDMQTERPSIPELFAEDAWDRLDALQPLYDGSILQADSIVENLINELSERGQLDATLVMITSDHGEAFGGRSRLDPDLRISPSWGISEEQTHVPLIVKYPNQGQGKAENRIASLTQVPDVIRSRIGQVPAADPFIANGVALSSTYRLLPEDVSNLGSVKGIERYLGPWRAAYENYGGRVRKYAKKGDSYATIDIYSPTEIKVVSNDSNSKVDSLYGELTKSSVYDGKTKELDEGLEEHLENLGYLR